MNLLCTHGVKLALRRAVLGAVMIAGLQAEFAFAQTNLPPERQVGSVTYRSGGVGEGEAQAMRAVASHYPLQLEFIARTDGGRETYIANVAVSIRDSAGHQVLRATTDGPFIFVRLPPGQYAVTASYEGTPREHQFAIPANGSKRVVLAW